MHGKNYTQHPFFVVFCGVQMPTKSNQLFFRVASLTMEQSDHMHYNGVIMGAVASQITSLTIVYWAVDSDADQRKHQSSASLAFVRGIHWGPVNSLHKWPVTQNVFIWWRHHGLPQCQWSSETGKLKAMIPISIFHNCNKNFMTIHCAYFVGYPVYPLQDQWQLQPAALDDQVGPLCDVLFGKKLRYMGEFTATAK